MVAVNYLPMSLGRSPMENGIVTARERGNAVIKWHITRALQTDTVRYHSIGPDVFRWSAYGGLAYGKTDRGC